MREKNIIKFNFSPVKQHNNVNTIEKSDDSTGTKRRYLQGVSSGMKLDAHGERMTDKCIKSFMDQANSGQVLLYPDIHGIEASNDIGILTKAEVQPDGNWFTEYRLYDENDDVGSGKLEKINNLWKQLNGMPPYKKPMQKGFSIEGNIPEGGIIEMSEDGRRVVDHVDLDGVVLVPRPAYTDSIAHSVYKALGEPHPGQLENVKTWFQDSIAKSIELQDVENKFFTKRMKVEEVFEDVLQKLMKDRNPYKKQRLDILFKEYSNIMIPLIVSSIEVFKSEDSPPENDRQAKKEDILKKLNELYPVLQKIFEEKLNGRKFGRKDHS